MQITADIRKISKTIQGEPIFIFNILWEYDINFVPNLIFWATENVVSFTLNDFSRKRGCITMRNYAETCRNISSYNSVYNVLIKLLSLQNYVSVASFSNAFYLVMEPFSNVTSLYGSVPLHVIFHLRDG